MTEIRPATTDHEETPGHRTEDAAWGFRSPVQARWPSMVAVLLAIVLYVTLPDRLIPGPRLLLPALEGILVVPLVFASPLHERRRDSRLRYVAIGLIAVINFANLATLGLLIHELVRSGSVTDGHQLILASVQIYGTNIVVFALWYWELDRGGPVARTKITHREPDFLFPQMVTPAAAPHRWAPGFVDYLYVSFTNATAFSPTDTMPLTHAAKGLMLVQSAASLTTVALVAARAVNILN